MFRFYEPLFLAVMLHSQTPHLDWVEGKVSEAEYKQRVKRSAEDIRIESERCKLSVITGIADKVIRYADSPCDAKAIITIATDSVGDIQRELLRHIYFRVPEEDKGYFDEIPMSEKSAKAFPSAVRDIRAAGRCFALDEHTACVLHLMRALEHPLAAMAEELGVSITNPNWHTVLTDCEEKIALLGNQGNQPLGWKEDKSFFSVAAANFRYFKDGWRNHVAHGRQTFGRPEAGEIFSHVSSFMDHLSNRISEKR